MNSHSFCTCAHSPVQPHCTAPVLIQGAVRVCGGVLRGRDHQKGMTRQGCRLFEGEGESLRHERGVEGLEMHAVRAAGRHQPLVTIRATRRSNNIPTRNAGVTAGARASVPGRDSTGLRKPNPAVCHPSGTGARTLAVK